MKLSAANGPCRLPWLLQIRNTFVLLCFINSKEWEIGGYLGHGEIGGYLGQVKIVVIIVGKFSSWCFFDSWCSFGAFQKTPPWSILAFGLGGQEMTWLNFWLWWWSVQAILPDGRWVFCFLSCFSEWKAYLNAYHMTLSPTSCDKSVVYMITSFSTCIALQKAGAAHECLWNCIPNKPWLRWVRGAW